MVISMILTLSRCHDHERSALSCGRRPLIMGLWIGVGWDSAFPSWGFHSTPRSCEPCLSRLIPIGGGSFVVVLLGLCECAFTVIDRLPQSYQPINKHRTHTTVRFCESLLIWPFVQRAYDDESML